MPSQPKFYADEGDELFGGGPDAEEDYLESTTTTEAAPAAAGPRGRLPRMGRTYKFMGLRYTTSGYTLKQMVEAKDYNKIITSYCVPIAGLGCLSVWGAGRLLKGYNAKMDSLVESYVNEMVYHDGDFEEMQMCYDDYKKRLVSLGLKKKDIMMVKFLEVYAKKKPISPKAISSLSHVFSMYKLSEEKAANLLCEASESMKDKVSSAGKLLFFGTHILRSPEAQEKLAPIKDRLASTYRKGGTLMVENSQKAMGEAAYRAAVVAAGKDQSDLTVGWELLGLTNDTARRIFDEVAGTGFKSKREEIYGGGKQKYDDKGRKTDDDGKLLNDKDREEAEKEKADGGSSGGTVIMECTECGFTLFPAKGREFKFFPDTFKCPECNASKDKFKDVSD